MLEEEKRRAAEAAVQLVESGMRVGLGTGSTANYAIRALGRRWREERQETGLRELRCVATSAATATLARAEGLPLAELAACAPLDLTIDGADAIDPQLNLIKGGGGALLREKIVARASRRMIVIADHGKLVARLGAFPLPIEIAPFAWRHTLRLLEATLCETASAWRGPSEAVAITLSRREGLGGEPFITENGGYLLDAHLGSISDARTLESTLQNIPGVWICGVFVDLASEALIGDGRSVRRLQPPDFQGSAR